MMNMAHKITYFSILLFLLTSCSPRVEKMEEYVAVYKRDTAYLSISIGTNSYYGTLMLKKRSGNIEKGAIRGKIKGDLFDGDYLYRPYKAKLEKRRAMVFKRDNKSLIQGTGLENIYMGIPYYDPASIHFDNAKFVFYPVGTR